MSSDFVTMLYNISQSMPQVMIFFRGLSYLIGIAFILAAFARLKKASEPHSHEGHTVPLAFFLGGAALLFLPTMIQVLSNSSFGSENVLQYTNYQPHDFYSAMTTIIKLAGIVWFVRGCALLVHSSHPGVEHGRKGLIFLIAGILAMNFEATMGAADYIMNELLSISHVSSH